jgi:hypothetical protein
MPKGIKKNHLPQKLCIVCKRSFRWRKKWEKVWDDIKYCSHKCQNNRKIYSNAKKKYEGNPDK